MPDFPTMRITLDARIRTEAEAECRHVAGGLAVTRAHLVEGWRITHARSGHALGYYERERDAIAGLHAVLPLADWTLDGDVLRASPGLADVVRSVIGDRASPPK